MKDYDELVIAIEIAEQLDADVEMSLDDYRKTKKKMKLSERVNSKGILSLLFSDLRISSKLILKSLRIGRVNLSVIFVLHFVR